MDYRISGKQNMIIDITFSLGAVPSSFASDSAISVLDDNLLR
jgi:hypothetical protein